MSEQLVFEAGPIGWAYLTSGVVAGLVGFADIISRYRDDPWRAVITPAALGYVTANALFGVLAYWLSMVLGVVDAGTPRPSGGALTVDLVRSGLIVGFGATLILRAVAFKVSIGGKVNELGPSTIVDALLKACDQEIDRKLAERKDARIRALMAGVSFEKAKEFIPSYCLALVQTDEERAKRLGELVAAIGDFKKGDAGADAQRAYLLGNSLINIFGHEVAKGVIDGFKTEVSTTP